jgi:hypothetical protein
MDAKVHNPVESICHHLDRYFLLSFSVTASQLIKCLVRQTRFCPPSLSRSKLDIEYLRPTDVYRSGRLQRRGECVENEDDAVYSKRTVTIVQKYW